MNDGPPSRKCDTGLVVMWQLIQNNLLLAYFVFAIFAEINILVGLRFWWGKPKGPDFSSRTYEYWYDPKREFISKLGIFFVQVLSIYILMLLIGLFKGYIKWPF